jgi:hypothetical protein
MANSKYGQVPAMAASGQLNWSRDHVIAYLYSGSTFSAAHTRLSEVAGTQVAVSEIEGRYVGSGGEAVGMPATFPRVPASVDYQVVVVVDQGGGYSPGLIAYYDTDSGGGTFRTANNGDLIMRPVTFVNGNPENIGTWFVF